MQTASRPDLLRAVLALIPLSAAIELSKRTRPWDALVWIAGRPFRAAFGTCLLAQAGSVTWASH
jgi:hypothetical protein